MRTALDLTCIGIVLWIAFHGMVAYLPVLADVLDAMVK